MWSFLFKVSYQQNRNFVPITSYKNDVSHDGSYQFSFTTGDGQQQQQSGYLKNRGQPNSEAQVVQGSYSYTSPEGKPITVTYIADELGFRAEGNHLPTPPPIPEVRIANLCILFTNHLFTIMFSFLGHPKVPSINQTNTTSSCHPQL